MTSTTLLTNTFVKGMNMDSDVTLLGSDQYRYAENVRLVTNDGGTTGVLLNIEGVKKYPNLQIPDNEIILGCTVINDYAVVITKVVESGVYKYNKVYRIDGFASSTPTTNLILRGDIGICIDAEDTNVSIVGNYETENNIKVYFTDSKSSVKILNIIDGKYVGIGPANPLLDADGNILNPLSLDITPSAELPPFQIVDLLYGNLASGVILYCYQLFNIHGAETTLSTLSSLVHLTTSTANQTLIQYKGSAPNTGSGKSCVLSAPLRSHDFLKCRIISISYAANNTQPRIYIVDEIDLIPLLTTIDYQDSGNNIIGELTVELFNALTGYLFIASTITKMDNRLFAANILENSWNPEFDARAYRINNNREIALYSANSANNIKKTLPTDPNEKKAFYSTIPASHDCINPFNTLLSSQFDGYNRYEYSDLRSGGMLKGGSGPNIDYTFITAATYNASTVQDGLPLADMPSTEVDTILFNYLNVGLSLSPMEVDGIASINPQSGIVEHRESLDSTINVLPNYANPLISAKYTSLLRDEIYRYGIILYNKKHVPSPVKWIGDIRIPHASEREYSPFYPNSTYINGKPLGIKFMVRNLPEGCIAFEIVRCDRTEADRSILMQAAISIVANNTIPDELGGMGGPTDTRPYIHLSYGNPVGTLIYNGTVTGNVEWSDFPTERIKKDYVTAISPEISFLGSDIEKSFKSGAYFDSIYALASRVGDYWIDLVKCSRIGSSADNVIRDKDGATVYHGTGIGTIIGREGYRLGHIVTGVGVDYGDYATDSLICKYYIPFTGVDKKLYPTTGGPDLVEILLGSRTNCNILDVKYPKMLPYNSRADKSPYYQTVGDIAYLNFALSTWNDIYDHGGTATKYGPFGPCLVIQAKGVRDSIYPINIVRETRGSTGWGSSTASEYLELYSRNAIQIVNIKKSTNPYGGNTFGSRQNSIYIPISAYKEITPGEMVLYTYGGDTFLNILDLPVTTIFQDKNPEDYHDQKIYVGAYIPFESSINLNLAYGDAAHRSYRASDNFLDVFSQLEPGLMGSYHTLDAPFFAYNSVYSTLPGSKKFIPASIYAENDIKTSNRIICSEAKTGNEILDSWTEFKFANYLDVDNQYGKISNLKAFKDRLYFWLNSALGIASVNERSLILDNNIGLLTLGTGGILTRADYLSTSNGSSIVNDRSIVNSDNTIYWYDFDKNEICNFSDRVLILSKEKGTQSYLNELFTDKRNVTLALYDKKYNEVWFKFYDKSLIFNEQLDLFTAFYTFNPQWALLFSDKTVTIKDNKFYIINTLDTDNTDPIAKLSKIEFVVNKDAVYTKTFDNVAFSGEFVDPSTSSELTAVLKMIGKKGSIKYNTKNQLAYPLLIDDKAAIDYREYTYRFAIGREQDPISNTYSDLTDSYAGRMKGKYLICNYTFDCADSRTFKLPYINTTYRYSLV